MVIVVEYNSNVIDFIGRLKCLHHIADMLPFQNIAGEIDATTRCPNWLWCTADKMHLRMVEIDFKLFNGFPVVLNTDWLPPSFKCD